MSQLVAYTYSKRDVSHSICKERQCTLLTIARYIQYIYQSKCTFQPVLGINVLIKVFPLAVRVGPILLRYWWGVPGVPCPLWGQLHHCSLSHWECGLVRVIVYSVDGKLTCRPKFYSRRFCKLPRVHFPVSKALPCNMSRWRVKCCVSVLDGFGYSSIC